MLHTFFYIHPLEGLGGMTEPSMIGKISEIRWLHDGECRFLKRSSLLICTLFTLSFCTGVLDGNGGKPGQSPNDNIKNNPNELIITAGATDITDWSARLSAFANPPVEMNPLEIGILYTSEKTITLENSVKLTSKELDSDHMFTVSAVGLSPQTQYYYKSYVLYGDVYRYGEIRSFTTKDIEGVDLGLSVKWASRNMGEVNLVDSAEEYGDYYAWGEVEPYYTDGHSQDDPCNSWRSGKTGYNWESYKWCNGSYTSLTKYNTVDNLKELQRGEKSGETIDDVARKKLGGKWRIPSYENFKELIDNCDVKVTIYNGRMGYKFTSKIAGFTDMWIFLPNTGYRHSSNIDPTILGHYWTSSLNERSTGATCIEFSSSYSTPQAPFAAYGTRCSGLSVRPVCDK